MRNENAGSCKVRKGGGGLGGGGGYLARDFSRHIPVRRYWFLPLRCKVHCMKTGSSERISVCCVARVKREVTSQRRMKGGVRLSFGLIVRKPPQSGQTGGCR